MDKLGEVHVWTGRLGEALAAIYAKLDAFLEQEGDAP